MDLADAAEALEALERAQCLARVRAQARLTLPQRAACLNCDAATLAGARWCDAECRDDYLRQAARMQKGS